MQAPAGSAALPNEGGPEPARWYRAVQARGGGHGGAEPV